MKNNVNIRCVSVSRCAFFSLLRSVERISQSLEREVILKRNRWNTAKQSESTSARGPPAYSVNRPTSGAIVKSMQHDANVSVSVSFSFV